MVFFGIILALLFLEVSLRTISFVKEFDYVEKSAIESTIDVSSDDDVISIFVLGESTSVDKYYDEIGWPVQLEDILNSQSNNFKYDVNNNAEGGTISDYLVAYFFEYAIRIPLL